MRIPPHLFLVAACATIACGAVSATAAVYFVDGACATSGTGVTLTCGATGPFRTIAEGVGAMQAGDTLNVRGAHDAFDGVYFESMALRNNAAVPGKALACTAGSRCVIQGCRAPACPTSEQPIVRGMTRRSDWVSQGGGVYARTMEASPNPDGLQRDTFDPHMLVQGTATPFTPLSYAGDGVLAPRDGAWSYRPSTHQVFVNPVGTADPATTVYVPHFGYNVHLQSPSANVTLQYLTFEGSRGRSIEIESLLPNHATGVILSHVTQRYVPRYFTLTTRGAPGLVIEDSLAEYGCRGFSWAQPTNDGCMGYRLFGIAGGVVRRNVIRHLGATGRQRLSGPNAWPCPWCDAPWNDPNNTDVSAYGLAYQLKQTEGAVVEDNLAEDVSTGGISLDVSRHVTVQRNTVRRAATGVWLRNFTPTGGCPSTAATEFCYNSDHVIRANVFDEVGFADMSSCGLTLSSGSERHVGATMFAQVYNNTISRVGFGAICIQTESATPTADLSIWNNTVYGARNVAGAQPPSGLVVRDGTRNVVVRNNVFDGITGDGLVVTAAGAVGLSVDNDVVGTISGCGARWNVPAFNGRPTGGICDTLAAHEPNGRAGTLRFANVAAVPPDLHLTAGSVAIDAGAPVSVPTDMDGQVRPQGAAWDAGADEFTGAVATTTSTSAPTSTTTSSTTSTIGPTTSTTSTTTTSTIRTTTSTSPSTTSTSTTRPTTSSTPSSSTTTSTFTTTTTTSLVPRCGNGIVEGGEECDDGNTGALDGCDGVCLTEEIASTASGTVLGTSINPPDDPIAATVTSRHAGPLVIVETSSTVPPPADVSFAERQVHVEAPAGSRIKPLVLTFTIDGALFRAPVDPARVKVFKDGGLVRTCTGARRRGAADPCVSARVLGRPGPLTVTVLTSRGGEWNFGTPTVRLAAIERCLAGTELLLRDNPRSFLVRSRDTSQLVIGDGADIPALLAQGGSLRVTAIGGDGFDETYPLPAAGWAPLDPRSPGDGVRYRDAHGPITTVVFRSGSLLLVRGKGRQLEQTLASDPDLVQVALQLGEYRYRLEFGGAPRQFKVNRKLLRRRATRPACPALP